MTTTTEDLYKLIPGSKFIVSGCEANRHGDNAGCLCHLKGKIITAGKMFDTPFVGTPTWHIDGMEQRFRLSEVTLVAPD